MEGKESTDSGSPGGNSETESQPWSGELVPEMSRKANISTENGGLAGFAASAGTEVDKGGSAVDGGSTGGASAVLMLGKKKRGRPKKYDAQGNLTAAYLASIQRPRQRPLPGFTLSTTPSCELSSGSRKVSAKYYKEIASSGDTFFNTAGGDFTPHVVTVYTGEDVAGKILTFAQRDSRGLCVLSANGTVSNVAIRQPGLSAGILTYEGRFEILTLTGSYTASDNGGFKSLTGGLSVSLASHDGRVIGGGVAGLLRAASPIQVVVGSFVPNGYMVHKIRNRVELRPSCPTPIDPATVTEAIPISQAAPEGNTYPRPTSCMGLQSSGDADLSNRDHPNSASTDATDWNSSGPPSSDQRQYPDIDLSVPPEEQ